MVDDQEPAAALQVRLLRADLDRAVTVALIDDLTCNAAIRPGDEPEGDRLARAVLDSVRNELADDQLCTVNEVGGDVIVERSTHIPAGLRD